MEKKDMSFFAGFLVDEEKKSGRAKVFDWAKAVDLIKEHQIHNASAGLLEDWGCTAGSILRKSKPVSKSETYTYLASTWATPVLEDNGNDKLYECWKWMDETEWNAQTYWPVEVLEKFNEK